MSRSMWRENGHDYKNIVFLSITSFIIILAKRLFLPVGSIARLNLIVFNFLNCLSIIQRRYNRAQTVLFELLKNRNELNV